MPLPIKRLCISISMLLIIVGVLSCFLPALSMPTSDRDVTIPKSGTSAAKFVPAGWKVLDKAIGDLNGDGLADLALVLARQDEPSSFGDSPDDPPPRCLVILLKDKSGQYQRSALDWDIILPAGAGGGGNGEAFSQIKITKGSLWIKHLGGDNSKWGFLHKLRLVDGDWKLVGEVAQNYNSSEAHGIVEDENLLTGLTEYRYWDGVDDGRNFEQSFYILRLPAITDKPAAKSKGSAVRLTGAVNLLVGKSQWRGPSDLSASISGFHSGRQFTIIADVVDDIVTKRDAVVLLDSEGHPVKPLSSSRLARTNGYRDILRFSMDEMQVPKNFDDHVSTLGTIEVHDYDNASNLHCAMTTSFGGRRYPGELDFIQQPGLPRLAAWSQANAPDPPTDDRTQSTKPRESENELRRILEQ